MLTRTLVSLPCRIIKSALPRPFFYSFSISNYQPPASRLQQFTQHIHKLHDQISFKRAADLLGTLQADKQIYQKELETLEKDYRRYQQHQPEVVKIVKQKQQLQQSVNSVRQENQGIFKRHKKQIETIKVYGVARIARQVIEVSDHLNKAIQTCEQKHPSHKQQLEQLKTLYKHLLAVFEKHEIYQVTPTGQLFNPNEHHAIGTVETVDHSQVSIIAETKRTGWKLRGRVLREAYVIVYK